MKKLVRFKTKTGITWGELDLDTSKVYFVNGSVYEDWNRGSYAGKLGELELLPPCEPKNVVCLAYNFRDLVGKVEVEYEPLIFLKSPNTVIASNESIKISNSVLKTWVEVEIAIVLSKNIFNANIDEARDAILGMTIANDVTSQNILNRDHHLARSKSLPTYCPIGTYLSTDVDTSDLVMTTKINGRLTQSSSSKLRFKNEIESLVYISKFIPLTQGDLVLTGTPAGAMDSLIHPGDSAILSVQELGVLNNRIEKGI